MVFVEFKQFIVIILIEQGILSYFVIYVQFFYVLVYCLINLDVVYVYVCLEVFYSRCFICYLIYI